MTVKHLNADVSDLNQLSQDAFVLGCPLPTSDWISVKDRLPDVDGEYLTYMIGWNDCRFMDVMFFSKKRGSQTDCWYSDDEDNDCKVTHWMPLPKPPKGE